MRRKVWIKATNNVIEYKALLAGLRLSRDIQVKRLYDNCDFQLVVSQVNGNFTAKDKSIAAYLKQVIELLLIFEKFELLQIL